MLAFLYDINSYSKEVLVMLITNMTIGDYVFICNYEEHYFKCTVGYDSRYILFIPDLEGFEWRRIPEEIVNHTRRIIEQNFI